MVPNPKKSFILSLIPTIFSGLLIKPPCKCHHPTNVGSKSLDHTHTSNGWLRNPNHQVIGGKHPMIYLGFLPSQVLSTSNLGQVGLSPIQAPWGSILSNTWATQKSPCHLTVPLRVQVGRIFSTSYGTDCDLLQVCWKISVGRGCSWSYHSAQWPSSHFTDRSHTTELVSLGRSGGPGGSFGPELGGRSGEVAGSYGEHRADPGLEDLPEQPSLVLL